MTGAAGKPSRAIWLVAALGAVLMHAGALAAILADRSAEIEDDEGAPAIEIALDLAAPKVEQTDLPPGPETEASAAATAAVQQEKPVEEVALPKEIPTETPDPERVVAAAPTERPREEVEKPVVTPAETAPSQESVAAEATAPAPIEAAREAPVSTSPVVGNGEVASRVKAAWQKRLVSHLDRNKRYPGGGARKVTEVMLSFTLDRTGRVVGSHVTRSSGDTSFDEAALAMMRRADPVPAPPPLVADEGLTFTIPVQFRNKTRG